MQRRQGTVRGSRACLIALVFAASVVGALPVQASATIPGSIVSNGDFERPAILGDYEAFFPPGFDSWKVDSGSVDLVRSTFWKPASGAQSVDMIGNCCAAGSISQTLTTVPGASYAVIFALAANPDPVGCRPYPEVKRLEVLWDGVSVGVFAFNNSGHTPAAPGWTTITLPVTASTSSTTLRFTSLTSGSACGPALDDVSVVAPQFTCSASAVRRGSFEPVRANPAFAPCADDEHALARVSTFGVIPSTTFGLHALTDQSPDVLSGPSAIGDNALGHAGVDDTTIVAGSNTIVARGVFADAKATCTSLDRLPVLTATSHVAELVVNGVPHDVGNRPQNIPLINGTLRVNYHKRDFDLITQQALRIERSFSEPLVISEARAGFEGNPCSRR